MFKFLISRIHFKHYIKKLGSTRLVSRHLPEKLYFHWHLRRLFGLKTITSWCSFFRWIELAWSWWCACESHGLKIGQTFQDESWQDLGRWVRVAGGGEQFSANWAIRRRIYGSSPCFTFPCSFHDAFLTRVIDRESMHVKELHNFLASKQTQDFDSHFSSFVSYICRIERISKLVPSTFDVVNY